MILLSAVLFICTLSLVIWRPKGLGIGWFAAGGALAALGCGVVSLQDVGTVTGMVWNATLAFIAAVIISLLLDEIGFFEWAALHMARLAGGSGKRLFLWSIALGAVVSALFNNDGAALILTPIVLAQVRALHFSDRAVLAYVIASGFIADTASIPFIISNLVNIVTADFFGIGFGEYAARMLVPYLFSLAASMGMLYVLYRKAVRGGYDVSRLKKPAEAIKHPGLFQLAWGILLLLVLGYALGEWLDMPVSLIAGCAALLFLTAAYRSKAIDAGKAVREAPWTIIIFSIGMYVVVYGLRNAGLTELLGGWIQALAAHGLPAAVFGMGLLSALLSSVMNNLPSVLIGALAIDSTGLNGSLREALIYAHVIGCDLGPKMTPIGSLATLIWLHVLSRKGVRITWGAYCRAGILLTVPTLLVTLLGLWLTLL
ncbi:arsenic transporter [Paenibacillus sp. y28]|uniref:arsenic transporter n=1 Tax=Paenibacillus sp. y28 TaxID=3129110 RepID=UPI003015BF0E